MSIPNPGTQTLTWLNENGAIAVVIRPDSYVYGVASTPNEAEAMATALLAAIAN